MGQKSESRKDFDNRTTFGNQEANLYFLNNSKISLENKKILEIGSGVGHMTKHLLDQGYDVKGVEINQEYINKAKELYGDIPIKKVDSAQLPFEDNTFDIVISFDVFEHIPDSDEHLNEVSRVLKEKGSYLLQTPNKYTNSVFETLRWRSFTEWKKDHCSLHSYNEIIKRFNKNGFSIEFVDVPVVNDFFKKKVSAYLGDVGLKIVKIVNPDKFPDFLKTNFYVVAYKK